MSDVEKILLTAVSTVIGGSLLFLFGQVVMKIVLEPLLEIRKAIRDVQYNLSFHASVVTNARIVDPSSLNVARETFRVLFCQLHSATNSLPAYGLFSFLRLIPRRIDIEEAVRDLIRLSNTNKSSTFELTDGFYASIGQHLKIKVL